MQALDDRICLQPVEQVREDSTCKAQLTVTRCTPPQLTSSSDHQLRDHTAVAATVVAAFTPTTTVNSFHQILAPVFTQEGAEHDSQHHYQNKGQSLADTRDCSPHQSNNKQGLEHSSSFSRSESCSVEHIPSTLLSQDNSLQPLNTIVVPSSRERDAWRPLNKPRSAMSNTVKRSASASDFKNPVAGSSTSNGLSFPPDKRRNKLGYHRTSVACGHCRRRKIRCLLAKDDHQGRCSNCIRLKKECNFFPVENPERRPRSLSKPDISSKDGAHSLTSSPSPGLALGKLPPAGLPTASYAASLPTTPTFDDPAGALDSYILRHSSISSATSITSGRTSISHSTATSRRPSLAHIMPGLKAEGDYMNPALARFTGYEISPFSDISPGQADQFGLDKAFLRLTSSPMAQTPYSDLSHNLSMGSMTSLNSTEASDTQDEQIWHSRLNSIDNGMVPGYPLSCTYSPEVEFGCGFPDIYNISASASTASLTASASEVSNFADARLPGHVYMRTWIDASPISPHFTGEKAIGNDHFDYYPVEDGYSQMIEDQAVLFQSPLQSPKYVSHV